MRPLPAPPPEHALHDELLVARYAALDELADDERVLAGRLVADCPACAALAADLRVLARAIGSEALPPRRRDFRITPEQAEGLRGSSIERFLRRLTLPEAALLRPAAAAVMSLGLLLVVAGNVLPGTGDGAVREERVTGAPAADARRTPQPAPDLEDDATRSRTKAPEADAMADTSAREEGLRAGDTAAGEVLGEAAPMAAAPDDQATASASPMQLQASGSAAPPRSIESLPSDPEVAETLAAVREVAASPDTDGVVAAVSGPGPDLRVVLLVVGAVLTLGGLLVLLVTLLARRVGVDPLVR